MDNDNMNIAKNFSSHQFENTFAHMAGDIEWVNVGGQSYKGKVSVIAACTKALEYFSGISVDLRSVTAHEGNGHIAVETEAGYTEQDEQSVVASCDLYDFRDGKIIRIVSYNIELAV